LLILVLLGLIGAGATAAGIFLWANHHLRAARESVAAHQDLAARDHLRRCLEVWPRDGETLHLAARTARRLGALEEASGFLDRYEEVRGTDDDLVLERILLRLERGEIEDTQEFWKQRISQDHADTPLIFEALVRGFIRSYRLRDADETLDRWSKREPDNPQAVFMRGALEDLRERLPEALDLYQQAIALDPDRDDIRERLTDVQIRLNLAADALPHLTRLIRRQPDSAAVRLRLASCYVLLREKDAARRTLDGVLERWPDLPAALAARGELALLEGKPAEAETWLKRSLAQAPGQYEVHFQLYRCLVQLRRDEDAKAEEERAESLKKDARRVHQLLFGELQRRPMDAELHSEIGRLSLNLGSNGEGLRWLHSALQLNSRHKATHEALADYYRRMGNQGLAARHKELAQNGPPR
jgi:tetratricopeptide (TPR) repeat protein